MVQRQHRRWKATPNSPPATPPPLSALTFHPVSAPRVSTLAALQGALSGPECLSVCVCECLCQCVCVCLSVCWGWQAQPLTPPGLLQPCSGLGRAVEGVNGLWTC